MTFRLVDVGWGKELKTALRADVTTRQLEAWNEV